MFLAYVRTWRNSTFLVPDFSLSQGIYQMLVPIPWRNSKKAGFMFLFPEGTQKRPVKCSCFQKNLDKGRFHVPVSRRISTKVGFMFLLPEGSRQRPVSCSCYQKELGKGRFHVPVSWLFITCRNLSKAGFMFLASLMASSARLTFRMNPVYASRTPGVENLTESNNKL